MAFEYTQPHSSLHPPLRTSMVTTCTYPQLILSPKEAKMICVEIKRPQGA